MGSTNQLVMMFKQNLKAIGVFLCNLIRKTLLGSRIMHLVVSKVAQHWWREKKVGPILRAEHGADKKVTVIPKGMSRSMCELVAKMKCVFTCRNAYIKGTACSDLKR